MTYTNKTYHTLMCDSHRFQFEGLSFSGGTQILSTVTLENGIYRNIQGKKPFEIHIEGNYAPKDITAFVNFINDFSGKASDICIDTTVYNGAVLKTASLQDIHNRYTGKFEFVFEVI